MGYEQIRVTDELSRIVQRAGGVPIRRHDTLGELVEAIGAPQPRVSDHLRCLAWCGYVRVRREGSNVFYSIADERVLGILKLSEGILADNIEHVEACNATKGGC